jgi:hypothetical protein
LGSPTWRGQTSTAHLEGADLHGAYLEGAIGLTVEQLATVKTLYPGYLDPPLREQIHQQYLHLLEKPRYETGRFIQRPAPGPIMFRRIHTQKYDMINIDQK